MARKESQTIEERYFKILRDNLSYFLNKSSLLSFKPFDTTNASLLRHINGRAIRPKTPNVHSEFDEYNYFCSVVTSRPPSKMAFNSSDGEEVYYKTMKFGNDRFAMKAININLFDYDGYPIINQSDEGKYYSWRNNRVRSTVNFNKRSVGALYKCRSFLYLYSFPILNYFNKVRRCYRFITFKNKQDKVEYDKIRVGILQTQYFAINQLIKNTSLFVPKTKEIPNGWQEGCAWVFEEEYKDKAEMLRYKIEKSMQENNVELDSFDDWIENC